jgi:murein DD-endopeptidase MepM/ murein hydrolase activator NlpD
VRLRRPLAALPLLALLACATSLRAPEESFPAPETTAPSSEPEVQKGPGILHVVKKGETLYHIARTYGVLPSELMQANGISDPRTLEIGQELRIPGARAPPNSEEPPQALQALPRKPSSPDPARPSERAGPSEKAFDAPSPTPTPPPRAPLVWPLKGVLYARFGVRGAARHDGIDIAAPEGSVVVAAGDGTAIFVGEQSGYGKVVILRHAEGLVTVYAHNSTVLVKEGERVTSGQPIARVGQTGRTTGPHLHFEVREGTRPRNPLLYLP